MLRGSITALITPFRDGALDEQAFSRFVDWQVRQGTHGLVPVGTTGESPTVSEQEHKRIIELCVEASNGRAPVIAGTGSNNTAEAVHYTQFAKKAGADAALVVAPYYNKPSQEGLYQHFKAIQDAVDIPIVVYNIPGRSIVDIGLETMVRLAALPNIVGVKDATADLSRVSLYRKHIGDDFLQLSGEDPTALGYMAHGGHGCISVASNVAPNLCSQFQTACMSGDLDTARGIQARLIDLHKALFMEPSPAPAKYLASKLGLCGDEVRLPITPISNGLKQKLDGILNELALPGLA